MAAAIGAPGREHRPSRVAIRCTSAALLLTTVGWALAALAREVPPPAYQLAAHRADVPAAVLYAVALQESGAMLRGRLIPWPCRELTRATSAPAHCANADPGTKLTSCVGAYASSSVMPLGSR